MLNIADTLHRWCREARPFALATVVDVSGSAPLPVGTSVAVDDGRQRGRQHLRRLRRGRGVRAVPAGARRPGAPAAGPVRLLRRRRLRRRPDLRRRTRRTRPARRPRRPAPSRRGPRRQVPAGCRSPWHRSWTDPQRCSAAPCPSSAATARTTATLGDGQADRAVAAQVRALLRAGRTARIEVGGDADTCPEKLTVLVHAPRPAPHADLRRRRLRRRPQPGRTLPRLPRHRLRRPSRLRHPCPLPARRRGRRRLAPPLPGGHRGRRPHRRLRPHPRRQVRHPPAAPGPRPPRRLRRRDGLPPHPRTTAWTACARPASHEEQLARLHSPIGLDLGARTPEETAISITAEIIAHTNRGTGLPLSRVPGPIHGSVPEARMPSSAALLSA